MTLLIRLFLLYLLFLFSCKDQQNISEQVSRDTTNIDKEDTPLKAKFKLVQYPDQFLIDNGLEDWDDFRNLYESLNSLKDLDLRGVEVNILGILARVKKLMSESLPGGFEAPQIRSRLKVVQMQTQKSRYFTRHYKHDSLIPSLKALYSHYNALIYRMKVLKEESNVVSKQ